MALIKINSEAKVKLLGKVKAKLPTDNVEGNVIKFNGQNLQYNGENLIFV